jgi:hypothetical protein
MTLMGDERTLMESLWRLMARDYARPLAGEDVMQATGLGPVALARTVRDLAARPHPYVEARFHPDEPDRLVELRLTVDGQIYCRARD